MRNTMTAKIPGMRNAREWSVMPTNDDHIIVQSDGAIGMFDWRTGSGKLCTRGGYFPHLAIARPYTFPQNFVQACLRACPSLGGRTNVTPGHVVKHTARMIDEAD